MSSSPQTDGEKPDATPAFRFQDSDVEEAVHSAREEKSSAPVEVPPAAIPPAAIPPAAIPPAAIPAAVPTAAKPAPEIDRTPTAPAKPSAPKIPSPVIPKPVVTPQSPVAATPPAPRARAAQPTTPKIPAPVIPTPKIPTPVVAKPAAPAPKSAVAQPTAATPQTPPKIPAPQIAAPVAAKTPAANAPRTSATSQATPSTVAAPKITAPEVVAESLHSGNGFSIRPYLDKLDPIAMLVSQAAAVGIVASLAYILWGIFGGHIGDPKIPNAANAAQNIALAAKVLRVCAFALAVCSIQLMLDVTALGPALAAAGVALQFGAAPVLGSIGKSPATFHLIENFRSLGFALLVLGVLKSTVDFGRWMIDRPNRLRAGATVGAGAKREAKQQNIAANATMFSPCWNLPFCREAVRVRCPAFLAKQKCWKFGRGCMCDQELVKRAINNAPVEVIKSPTEMSRKKPPCGQCSIFLEHQSLKYKMISPITIPVTIAAAVIGWPYYENFWEFAGGRLSGLWTKMSFSASNVATNAANKAEPNDMDKYTLAPEQVLHAIQTMTGVLLAFFLLIYVAKFLEWAILKMKW